VLTGECPLLGAVVVVRLEVIEVAPSVLKLEARLEKEARALG
jgi:hypothetical protein